MIAVYHSHLPGKLCFQRLTELLVAIDFNGRFSISDVISILIFSLSIVIVKMLRARSPEKIATKPVLC
jgi:hypothetical protein